jgi:hypothetical protein
MAPSARGPARLRKIAGRGYAPGEVRRGATFDMQLTCQSFDGGKMRKSEETKPCRQTRAAHTFRLGADWAISLSVSTLA